jgi:hypothetical protein
MSATLSLVHRVEHATPAEGSYVPSDVLDLRPGRTPCVPAERYVAR